MIEPESFMADDERKKERERGDREVGPRLELLTQRTATRDLRTEHYTPPAFKHFMLRRLGASENSWSS
jgi:hypothetical protein